MCVSVSACVCLLVRAHETTFARGVKQRLHSSICLVRVIVYMSLTSSPALVINRVVAGSLKAGVVSEIFHVSV